MGSWGSDLVQDELRLRARPLLRNGPGFAVPVMVDTGQVPGSRQYTVGPEFAAVLDQLDCTTVICPGQTARGDEWKNLIVVQER